MNNFFLSYILCIPILLWNCKNRENANTIKDSETEIDIDYKKPKTLCQKLLQTCCYCCTLDNNSENSNNSRCNTSNLEEINLENSSFEDIASSIVLLGTNLPHVKYYYTRYDLNKEEKLYIKYNISLDEQILNENLIYNSKITDKFSIIINKMFKTENFIFYIKNTLNNISEKKIAFLKFTLEPEIVDFLKVEKKNWKNLSSEILGEPSLYSEFPLVPRLPNGVCTINPKELMIKTHFCMFFPSVIDNQFITLKSLTQKIEKSLDLISLTEATEENSIQAYISKHTPISKHNTMSNLYEHEDNYNEMDIHYDPYYKKHHNKILKKYNMLSYGKNIDLENINFMMKYYLINNANKWSLICKETVNCNSTIPFGYKQPNVIEAIFIMLYAIKNNIKSIYSSGIPTSTQGEKIDNQYVIEYTKKSNSISINLKSKKDIENYILIKPNCGENTIQKTGYQKGFINPTDICYCCPSYCCHENILLKNPFYCSSNCSRPCFLSPCIYPAISGLCIYPTSNSCCDRCTSLSCSENKCCCLHCFCETVCVLGFCASPFIFYLL